MITASIVSHSHGEMVWGLVERLLSFPEVSQVIVTLNIPESHPLQLHDKVVLVKNSNPKGFGANHNAAFALVRNEFYCVINPDIELPVNPFGALVNRFAVQNVALAAPLVLGATGATEDSMRRFLTPWSIAKRVLGLDSGVHSLQQGTSDIAPDWLGGMFMLFRSGVYAKVGGFDERYFMYCEDADICTRLWRAEYKVIGCLSVSVIHNAQRASHRSLKHLFWHLRSMARYFLMHSFSLPNKDTVIQRG